MNDAIDISRLYFVYLNNKKKIPEEIVIASIESIYCEPAIYCLPTIS